jgi:hypothetical protein
MSQYVKQTRLETEAIVVGYAMSRLDVKYLSARNCKSWKHAFAEAADALSVRSTSIKNLRDEFDPMHPNSRKGWHKRALRKNRQRVLVELQDVSDAGLLELIGRIIRRDEEPIIEAIDTLSNVTRVVYNVAERLLTGRKAEDYFIANSQEIFRIAPDELLDFRQSARGFDFGVRQRPEQAIEIKGIKSKRGDILFTDREWTEAECRGDQYWLVVVGNLRAKPIPHVVRNPHASLSAKCDCRTSVTVSWRSSVRVA